MEDQKLIDRMLRDPKTTRRQFMVGATAAGLTASAASGLWDQAQAATPKRGGHMKCGLNDMNTGDSLDPATWNATGMIVVGRAVRDSLVEVGQDNTAQPGLAESWEASADAKTWRFKLRSGVEFSNGKSLTTEDVINSINVHRGEDSKSGAKGVFAGIDDVQADGKDVVVVSLSGGNADFPFLMTDYHMNMVPTVDGKADVLSKIGTGLYTLEEFDPGIRVSMKRAPNAWQQDDFGYVDSCEITAVLDDAARQNALMTGQVDVINRPALSTINLLKRNPNIKIQAVPSNLMFTMPMHVNTPPFDSLELRMALKHALDRQAFVDKILFGYGVVGNDQPIGPGFLYHDPDVPQNDFDLDKAKSMLAKAGMDGVTVPYHVSDTAFGGALDAAQLFQADLAKIGVNLDIIREPKDGYWNNVWNKKPFCACYWGARPVEDMILSIAYTSDAPWNDTRINIPRVDELVTAARAELDPAKRKVMYSEVQALISSQGGTLIPAFGQDVAGLSQRVQHGALGGGWEMDGGHFIKRWWLDA
ncbi:MAG: ABC transporter substrate-binding protein [Pseudomonadota bacterium]